MRQNLIKSSVFATAAMVAPNNNKQAGKLVDNPTDPTRDDVVVGYSHCPAIRKIGSAPLV